MLIRFALILVLLMPLVTPATGRSQEPPAAKPAPAVRPAMTAEQVARTFMPGVVTIVCDSEGSASLGSGFVVRPGIIATNLHVVAGMHRGGIARATDSSSTTPKWWISEVLAVDERADLALLSVPDAARAGLTTLPLASNAGAVAIGQKIFALGSPRGLSGTISEGIVSALRSEEGLSLVQITAPISPGSSGGPVISDRGEVVAVAVASLMGGQNLNFAVPAAKVAALLARLNSGGRERAEPVSLVEHAWKATPSVAEALGVAFARADEVPEEEPMDDDSVVYDGSLSMSTGDERVRYVPLRDMVLKEVPGKQWRKLSLSGVRLVEIRTMAQNEFCVVLEDPASRFRVPSGSTEFYFYVALSREADALREAMAKYKGLDARLQFYVYPHRERAGRLVGEIREISWVDRKFRTVDTMYFTNVAR